MTVRSATRAPIELWGGIECTMNRVRNTWFDQIVRSGHEDRLDDLERFADLGLRVLRYPVLWERMAPHGVQAIDWGWADTRLSRMRELGIRPIVGLVHHGSGPEYTSLVDERFPELLAAFAEAVARRYPWVTDYTPVNEPLTTARFSGLYGHWYPHGTDAATCIRALVTQARGIALAMRAIRTVTPGARLIQTEDCGRTFGTSRTGAQVAHEEQRRWLTWDLLTGRVDRTHPLWEWLLACGAAPRELEFFIDSPCPPDVLGLNYYLTSDRYLDSHLERYPSWLHGGNGAVAYADVEAVRVRPDGIVGHERHLLDAWERYQTPVAITEVHLACSREEQLRWLLESWHGAHRARAAGADVRAVTAWALLGSFDWNSLVTRDAGHYEPGAFDLRAPRPRRTALATAVRALATEETFEHPVAEGPGWWRRPERVVYRAAAIRSQSAHYGRPLVVLGAPPLVADALRRACALRGLGLWLAGHHDVDLMNPAAVDAMLRHLTPWAVLDVTCTLLEGPSARRPRSRPVTITEHVNLAAACRRRAIALAAWSSGLVFDGGAACSYTEDDPVAPGSEAAVLLADTERRVRDVLPASLVFRAGILFGPGEELLLANVGENTPLHAVAAMPSGRFTYVPHLVDVLLDLLIDGESGVWHLANEEAISPAPASLLRLPQPDAAAPEHGVAPPQPAAVRLRSLRGWLMPGLERALADHAAALTGAPLAGGLATCASP